MSLAINAINAYSGMSAVRPMNYSVENRSEVSSAYTESVKEAQNTSIFPDIGAVNPIQYPNAQTISINPMEKLAKTQSVSKDMNAIAAGFSGVTTGYDNSSQSYGYQMIGSTIDFYA